MHLRERSMAKPRYKYLIYALVTWEFCYYLSNRLLCKAEFYKKDKSKPLIVTQR